MGTEYIRIADETDGEAIEIPTEDNGTIFLSSISAQFPGVCGLKYRNPDTDTMRGIKLVEGILYPPDQVEYWKDYLYLTVYPKDNKRKMEDEDSQSIGIRSKRPAQKCSDLIVLGLPWKVDEKALEAHFASFGELVMTLIKRDNTGKSKGYGFIRFANYEAQEAVLCKLHMIEGRRCEVKIPHSKEEPQVSSKIFVGRITESMTKEELKTFFEQFGVVDDVYIPTPFRSFAFVTFRESAVAQKLIGEDHLINGVSVHINTAEPKGSKDQSHRQGGGGMSDGGMPFQYGGGRGGAQSDSARYFGNSVGGGGGGSNQFGNPRNNMFSGAMAQNSAAANFNQKPGFNVMNPAVLAAALDSWNSMLNGVFMGSGGAGNNASGGGGRGQGWQGSGDMKKDGNSWGGKGDNKW